MTSTNTASEPRTMPSKLADYGELQNRYQNLPLAERAKTLLYDAEPAIQLANSILEQLAENNNTKQAINDIRLSLPLIAKLRSSEAKNILIDSSVDFIEATIKKVAAWRRNMQRLSQGEGIQNNGENEYIAGDTTIALALIGNGSVSSFLSIIQIILGEMVRIDGANASHYAKTTAQIRRCATILSDCDTASDITKNIH